MKPLAAVLALAFAAPVLRRTGCASVRRARSGHDGSRQRSRAVAGRQASSRSRCARPTTTRTRARTASGSCPSGGGKPLRADRQGAERDQRRAGRTMARRVLPRAEGRRQPALARRCEGRRGAGRRPRCALDVNNFKLSPDGKHVLLSIDVFTDCAATLACTKKKLDARKADKASGTVYDKLFVRHWDTWADGRRSQLFIADARRRRQDRRRAASAEQGHRRRRAVQAVRRRHRIRVLAGWRDGLLRRAHRRQDRAVVDELRHLLGAGRRLGRAEEPHRRQPGLGRLSAAVGRRQDAVLPRDEARRLRGGPLRHHGDRSRHAARSAKSTRSGTARHRR